MDAIDHKILHQIQADAGLSVAEIADKAGLSPSPCWRRIKKLEDDGVILGRVAVLDRDRLGLDFTAYASVKLARATQDNLTAFERKVMQWPEVVECATVTGAVDYVLRIVTTDIAAYDHFLRTKLLNEDDIVDVQTRIVVRDVKRTTRLPLHLVD